jgi:AcrR family transcriptional regulator
MITTKEKILSEALSLFAVKGYSAVYVGEIADAVGIKTSSLYKHFKGKQDIFDSCVEAFSQRMEKIRNDVRLPETPEANFSYQTASIEKLVEVSIALFVFYLQDDVAAKFRKMLMIERYHNPELNKLFEDFFIYGVVAHEEKIFADLINAGAIKKENPHIIALRFYTPIFYLWQKYDTHPDEVENAKEELAAMVREFCNTYQGEVHADGNTNGKGAV